MENNNLHTKLKKVLVEDGTVLFIGSGISAWSGLPSWRQLLDEMANYVEQIGRDSYNIRYYSNSQPLLAADFGCAALKPDDFKTFIWSACKRNVAEPSIVHQLLVNLGVSCYITTNYDRLLEQALRQNGILNRFKVVTNREPTDCADLLYLRRRNFIFKPHGDIEQVESIVLSNKQYDELYENGNKFYTYRALETLLTTRDIVFVGFGLTDPDFMRIMGKFRNEFQTNLCTHYAIMPDISQIEKEYWAENYGIQILSYETEETKDGRNYSTLLELLDSLATKSRKPIMPVMTKQNEEKKIITKKQRVALQRYARYVIQQFKIQDNMIFPLMFQCHEYGRCYKLSVEKILSEDIEGFILTGNPGTGKTYFLKQYCMAQAERLQEWCEQNKIGKFPKIPVYIDLKNYSGKDSIKTLIESQFPSEIPIMEWIKEQKVFLLFDSFNEVERKYLENNTCIREIRKYSYNNDIVIATRFKNVLNIHLPEYRLGEVEEEYVIEYLENQGIMISLEQEEIVVQLLQKPLIFYLLVQGKIKIDYNITLKSIYESYFRYLNCEIRQILDLEIDFISIFDGFAYYMFENGIESFCIEEIEKLFDNKISELEAEERRTLINWLIDVQKFLIPASLKNISFFHQSITEFLAAHFFANQFKNDQNILKEKLQYIQWNYVLVFAIEFLDEMQAEKYLGTLLQTDSLLAVQACSYLEYGMDQLVTSILKYILKNLTGKNFEYYIELGRLLEKLPVTENHQDILRKLMKDKDIIGGAAAECLLQACGDCVKDELLEEMFQNLDNYNYVTSIGNALSKIISLEDYATVVLRLGKIKIDQNEEEESQICGFDTLPQYLPLEKVVEIFQPVYKLNVLQRQLLTDILQNAKSQEGFDICLNLIRQGWKEAIFPLYLYVKFNDNICLDNVDDSLIQYLVLELQGENVDKWIIGLIYNLYQRCQPFARGIRSRLKQSNGITRLTYLYAIGKNRKESFFNLYGSMLYFRELPEKLIGAFDEVDWEREADHIVEFLIYQNRFQDLSEFLEESFSKTRLYYLSLSTFLKLINIIEKIKCNKVINDNLRIEYSVGKFISEHVHKEDILNFYHSSNEDLQSFFNLFVLNYLEDLKLEDFSKMEIDLMLEDIKNYSYEDVVYEDEILLVNIASEEFVTNRLKTLLNTDNVCLRENIQRILEKVGERHLIRYIGR